MDTIDMHDTGDQLDLACEWLSTYVGVEMYEDATPDMIGDAIDTYYIGGYGTFVRDLIAYRELPDMRSLKSCYL